MKKVLLAVIAISLALCPAGYAAPAPTCTGPVSGMVIGTQAQATAASASTGAGDLYVGDELKVSGTSTFAGRAVLSSSMSVTGSLTLDGAEIAAASSEIVIDTGTVFTATDRYMVLNATGTGQVIKPFASTPILSTSTHTNGTVVTLICSEGSIVLDDNANQALGSDITLGETDTITLYLNGSVWYRIDSTDN